MAANGNTRESARAVMRGLWAVVVLFLTAADTLASAVLSVPPAAWMWRRVRLAVSDEYRRAYWDAIEAEVVEPGPDGQGDSPEEGGT
jgi:hypothetical protein